MIFSFRATHTETHKEAKGMLDADNEAQAFLLLERKKYTDIYLNEPEPLVLEEPHVQEEPQKPPIKYTYRAFNKLTNRYVSGHTHADNEVQAISQVKSKGLIILDIHEDTTPVKKPNKWIQALKNCIFKKKPEN